MKDKKKISALILVFEILVFVLSTFIILFINPSEDYRMRLVFICLQTAICTAVVFAIRFLFGVFKNNDDHRDNPQFSLVNLKILVSDILAFVVIYVIQKLLPPSSLARISFLQEVFIIGFNLIVAVFSRIIYQAIYDWCEPLNRQWEEK